MAFNFPPKQDVLVSGTNIKTINSNSILGSGNLTISGLPSSVNPTDVDKVVAVDSSGVASWQYAGLGAGSLGSGNVILGRNKPASLTGTDDVVIGVNAGNAMTTSIANVFIGKDCAKLTTSAGGSGGYGIVAIGTNCFSAATGSTNGAGCVFIGNDAATNATVGPYAVAIGSIAGNNAVIPQYAVMVGHRATGTGISPISIGTNANTGTYNNCIAIGQNASASGNSAIALGVGCIAGLETFAVGSTTAQIRTLQLGIGGNTNTGTMPQSVTITPTRVTGGWTNLSGANGTLILTGTNSTGFTPGSDILFQTCPTGTISSTTVNSVVERFRIKADTEIAVNDTGLDFDFRVEGDTDANLLFVDAGTDRVGVGNSTPAVKLHAQNTTAATNTVTNVLRVDSQSSGTPATGIGVGIEMAAETAAGNTEIGVVLEAVTTDVTSTSEDFDLVVKNMAAGATAAETLRVTSTGDVTAKTGNILIDTAGKGLSIKSGSNAKIGTATFTAVGSVTVNTTAVTANSLIFVTGQDGVDAFCVGNKVVGTSFDIIHSTGNATATVAWMIVEATP